MYWTRFGWVKGPFPYSWNKSRWFVWCDTGMCQFLLGAQNTYDYYMFCILSYWLRICVFLGTIIVSTQFVIFLCILIWLLFLFLSLCFTVLLLNLFLSINPNSDFLGILASSPTPFLIWFVLSWELPMCDQTMKKSYQFLKHLLCTTLNTVKLKCKLWTIYCSETNLDNHCEHWFGFGSCLES